MSEADSHSKDLPEDEHLRNDVLEASGDGPEASPAEHFTPGLTNAGQQVGGLASGTGYGGKPDPDDLDTNHPI